MGLTPAPLFAEHVDLEDKEERKGHHIV